MFKTFNKKKLLFLLALLLIPKNAQAFTCEDYMYLGERLPGIFYNKVADIGLRWYFYGDIIRRKYDDHFMYSIEPGMEISKSIYIGTDENIPTKSFITAEDWKKISVIAYYGYKYKDFKHNHDDEKWYAITQLLIWRILRPKWSINFAVSYAGSNLEDKYINEINELKELVDNHNNYPIFSSNEYTINLDDTLIIEDQNNIINEYKVENNPNLEISINNNKLIINPKKSGKYNIKIYRDFNNYSTVPLAYTNDYLDTMLVGNLDSITTSLSINVNNSPVIIDDTIEGSINYNNDDIINSNMTNIEVDVPKTGLNKIISNTNQYVIINLSNYDKKRKKIN